MKWATAFSVAVFIFQQTSLDRAASAQETPATVTVLLRGSQEFIKAKIFQKTDTCELYSEDCKYLGTSSEGAASARAVTCTSGSRLFAVPIARTYYRQSTSEFCPAPNEQGTVEIFVVRYDVTFKRQAAMQLYDAGNYGEAAYLFSDIRSEYLKAGDKRTSYQYYVLTLEAGAKALKLDPKDAIVVDRLQNRRVASSEYVAAIQKFQEQNDVETKKPGNLDTATFKALTGKTLSQIISEQATKD